MLCVITNQNSVWSCVWLLCHDITEQPFWKTASSVIIINPISLFFFFSLCIRVWQIGCVCGRMEGCMSLMWLRLCATSRVCVRVCVYLCVCYVQDAVCARSSWMPAVCASARHLIFAGRVHSVCRFQLLSPHTYTHTHTHARIHTLFPVMSLILSSMATVSEGAGGEREGKQRDPSFIVRGWSCYK